MGNSTMRGGRGRKFKADINVVPYIDVMLVLLIIFMVATPVANPGMIDVPTAAKSALPPPEYIQVVLKPDTTMTIGVHGQKGSGQQESVAGRAALLQKLRALHEASPKMPLMVAADKDMKYDEVIQVVSEAKKLGIDRVGLATRQ